MPRGGRPKKGLRRIDAAFDSLIPLGFSKEIVGKTIKALLEVYGGDEGWVFVEEAGYKLVIDAILEKQEEEDHKEDETNEMMIEGDDIVTPSALEMIEPVVDYGETSLHPDVSEGGLGRIENKIPAAIGYASPIPSPSSSRLPIIAGDSSQKPDPDPARSAGRSNLRQADEVPRQRRPPCYGWISETESSSSEES